MAQSLLVKLSALKKTFQGRSRFAVNQAKPPNCLYSAPGEIRLFEVCNARSFTQ